MSLLTTSFVTKNLVQSRCIFSHLSFTLLFLVCDELSIRKCLWVNILKHNGLNNIYVCIGDDASRERTGLIIPVSPYNLFRKFFFSS